MRHTLISQRKLLARCPPPVQDVLLQRHNESIVLRPIICVAIIYGRLNNHDGAVATIKKNTRLPHSNFDRILAAEMGLSIFPRLVAVQHEQFTVCLCSCKSSFLSYWVQQMMSWSFKGRYTRGNSDIAPWVSQLRC